MAERTRTDDKAAEADEGTETNSSQTAEQRKYAHEYLERSDDKESSFIWPLLIGVGISILMLWLLT